MLRGFASASGGVKNNGVDEQNHTISMSEADDLQDEIASMLDEVDKKANGETPFKSMVNKGKRNKADRWTPTEWKAEYEVIVAMHVGGLSGVEISRKSGFTPAHVYNILGTPQAIAIENVLIEKTRSQTLDITQELQEIQTLTVSRLKHCLNSDYMFDKSPLGFIGKGIEVMKGLGEHLKPVSAPVTNNTFVMPASVMDKFLVGMEKSDQARAYLASKNYSNNIQEAEVVG